MIPKPGNPIEKIRRPAGHDKAVADARHIPRRAARLPVSISNVLSSTGDTA